MAMIGCPSAGVDEGRPARTQAVQETVVGRCVDPGQLPQLFNVVAPGRSIEVGHGVGTERRKHPLAQTAGGQLGVLPQIRRGRVRGGDDLDVEAIEQCAWTKLRVCYASGDLVVNGIGRLRTWNLINPEDLDELMFQPVAGGRATEELPVLTKRTPDLSGVGFNRSAIESRHSKPSGLDALGSQHPEYVVIGNDQQLRWVGKWAVVGEHLRLHVAMHADQRQVFRFAIDVPGDAALLCRERESPVWIELEGRHR
jgi:hypothetical protein